MHHYELCNLNEIFHLKITNLRSAANYRLITVFYKMAYRFLHTKFQLPITGP